MTLQTPQAQQKEGSFTDSKAHRSKGTTKRGLSQPFRKIITSPA